MATDSARRRRRIVTKEIADVSRTEAAWMLRSGSHPILEAWLEKIGGRNKTADLMEIASEDARAEALVRLLRESPQLSLREAMMDASVSASMLYQFVRDGKLMLGLLESLGQIQDAIPKVIEAAIAQAQRPSGFKDRQLLFQTVELIKGKQGPSLQVNTAVMSTNPVSIGKLAEESEGG